jgi:hypothetical protein
MVADAEFFFFDSDFIALHIYTFLCILVLKFLKELFQGEGRKWKFTKPLQKWA